jgi:hypothetical protein
MTRILIVTFFFPLAASLEAAEPCQSGLQCGQRPGPYSFLVATGSKRGQSHCFVCETGDRPAAIVFARTVSEPLGRLLKGLDQAMLTHQKAELRGWTTFLSDSQPTLEPKLVEWSRELGLRNLPVGVFEDLDGPPSYRLNREADVTLLLSVKQKVVANFAFRSDELTDEKIKEVIDTISKTTDNAK